MSKHGSLGSFQYHSKLEHSLENTVYRVTYSVAFRGTHGEMILEFLYKRAGSGLLTLDPVWNGYLIGE